MKNPGDPKFYQYVLFSVLVPFLTLSTFSRYEPFAMSDMGLLVLTPVIGGLLGIIWYLIDSRNGESRIKIFKPRSAGSAIAFFGYCSLVYTFLVLSTLMRFNILQISDNLLYAITLGVFVAGTALFALWVAVSHRYARA